MKKLLLLLVVMLMVSATQAQKWADLSDEQKISQLQDFRADNQKYLKETLKLSDDQVTDIDNVNIAFLAALDRIDRYGKDDVTKEKWAKAAIAARSSQLDVIMGADKRKKFQDYVSAKLKKAQAAQKG
jgi:hypothetical protein